MDERELAEFRAWKTARTAAVNPTAPIAGAVNQVAATVAGQLPRPQPTAAVAPTAAGTGTALVQANLAAKQPIIDEAARVGPLDARGLPITAATSKADFYGGGLARAGDAFNNGFFKTASQRAGVEAARFPGALPRPAPVGGTSAVLDKTAGLEGTTRVPAVKPATVVASNGAIAPVAAAVAVKPQVVPRVRDQMAERKKPRIFAQR